MEAIVPGEYVSDFTKKTLEQFGWVAGDPIPQNMGDLLAKISERTPASKKAGVYIDADVMAETDVAAIKHALELAKKGGDIKKVPFDPGIPMPESTRQLLESLQDRDENNNTVEIVDDRAAEKPPAEPEKKEDTPVEQPIIPDPLPEAPAIEPFCPRCSWDMRHKFDVEISEADKEAFIAITLGGERFKKTYEIFAGKYAIRFRSMLAEENSEIHHQLLIDQKNGDFLSDTEWFLRLFEYRLACSIESITVNDKLLIAAPELSDVDGQELPNKSDVMTEPRIVRLRKYVMSDALKSEITRRMVASQFRQFQRLYEALEAMALEPNFWKGIE